MVGTEYLFPICDALKLNPRYLVSGNGSPAQPMEIDHSSASKAERLLDIFSKLDPDRQDHVLSNATFLSGMVIPKHLGVVGGGEKQINFHSPKDQFRSEEDES